METLLCVTVLNILQKTLWEILIKPENFKMMGNRQGL